MFAIIALLLAMFTGHTHTYGTPATNQGIYVQLDSTHCIGYEYTGTPGLFGNTLGLTGGDCR